MRRSSWGLSTPRAEPKPRCADPDVNPDWWSSFVWSDRGRAVHQCNHHCSVKAWCAKDVKAVPQHVGGTVMAGVFYVWTERHGLHPGVSQPKEVLCGACEQRRRAARELVEVANA